MYKGTSSSSVKKGNNIAVDPNIICYAEQSEVSLLNVILRSFTSVQDDRFAKKTSRGATSILLLK